jgi:hypothetical protein
LRRRRVIWTCIRIAAQLGEGVRADPAQAFPGQGHMNRKQAEIERLRRQMPCSTCTRDGSSAGRSAAITTELVTDALVMAIWRRGQCITQLRLDR